jgi:hypothetical protein
VKRQEMEPVSLPDGEIRSPCRGAGCSAYPCKLKAVVQVNTGGGYEYEPADLCLEHFQETVRLMRDCYERLAVVVPA